MSYPEILKSHRQHMGRTVASAFLLFSFFFLYRGVITSLIQDWIADDNYSHGFFIIPIALFFVWEKRKQFAAAQPGPSYWGLVFIFGSLGVLFAATLGSEVFLARISMLGVIIGAVLYIRGLKHLKIVLFPILFLLLMIPIPAILFGQIAFPLQLVASRFGELVLQIIQVPIFREGNVMHLPNISLEVVEACSGIRSLITLLTLGIVYGHFVDRRIWVRVTLAIATIPIAIFANGIRVTLTGAVAHYFSPEIAEGFFHGFSGWILFLIAFLMLFALYRIIRRAAPIHK